LLFALFAAANVAGTNPINIVWGGVAAGFNFKPAI
jgi:hypothetical protein